MAAAIVLIVVNAAFAFGLGWPLARSLAATDKGASAGRWFVKLLAIYLAECVAFSASMATNVFSYGLAVVWGLVLARWFAGRSGGLAPAAARFALYTSLPAVSFLFLLPLLAMTGRPLLDAEAGHRFGIPGFIPWPFCTLLGFFLAVSLSAVVVKTAVTTMTAAISGRTRTTPRGNPPPGETREHA